MADLGCAASITASTESRAKVTFQNAQDIVLLSYWFTLWLVYWLTDLLHVQFSEWLIYWLIDYFILLCIAQNVKKNLLSYDLLIDLLTD